MKLTMRQRRRIQDMTIDALSERSGVHRNTIMRLERNGTDEATVRILKKLAAALGCEVADIID